MTADQNKTINTLLAIPKLHDESIFVNYKNITFASDLSRLSTFKLKVKMLHDATCQ